MSQQLTMARLVTLPADVVDLTVEVRGEPVEEVVPESPFWDREELLMDDEEDGRAVEVIYRLQPNLLSQLIPIEDLILTSDSIGEEECQGHSTLTLSECSPPSQGRSSPTRNSR